MKLLLLAGTLLSAIASDIHGERGQPYQGSRPHQVSHPHQPSQPHQGSNTYQGPNSRQGTNSHQQAHQQTNPHKKTNPHQQSYPQQGPNSRQGSNTHQGSNANQGSNSHKESNSNKGSNSPQKQQPHAVQSVPSSQQNPSTQTQTSTSQSSCQGNTASTRSQWCNYSIDTDYMNEVVDTGVTKEYWLDLTNVVVAPDGVSRSAMAVNGSIPGPTIFADWGDTIVVHVTNSLTDNGTSIHWHGMRQNHTNQEDGVVSITQCPLAMNKTTTYTWKASQYGSSWYHSHIALQAWQGIFGGIIVNGPATENYDEDLGMLFLNDWDHQTVDELWHTAETSGPPTLDTGLINGTNTFGDLGTRFNTSFKSGTSYRMRLVNAAIDTHWKFSIDNHTLTVIAADLVPLTPYNTTVLDIAMGQRYDIIVNADQADVAENFWLRAIPQAACSNSNNTNDIKGIIYYGDSPATPSTSEYDFIDSCEDETGLTPHLSKSVEAADWTSHQNATTAQNSAGVFRWYLNSTTMQVDWENPTLKSIMNDSTAGFESEEAVFELNQANQWVYVIIQTTLAVPHPIHLHGHDFYVLAQGTGEYSSSVTLNTTNPLRRDTALLPASGYLVMAWETDNPGVWLMHCHIGWHMSEGFAVQFVERKDEIPGLVNNSTLNEMCDDWDASQKILAIEQEDSGI